MSGGVCPAVKAIGRERRRPSGDFADRIIAAENRPSMRAGDLSPI